jgi:Carboxypeptidase regulatory-like domain
MNKNTIAFTLGLLLFATGAAAQPRLPTDSTRAVTLSLTEYNRLIDLSNRPAEAASAVPVAVLASTDVRVTIDRDTARGTFNVVGEVLRPGVHRVNLLSSATLIEASAGGRPVPLVAEGNTHAALIEGPGPFGLTLEWGAPLKFTPGRGSLLLPVPQSGTARATFDLPGEQADVRLSAGLVTRRSAANGRTIVEATLDPGSSTEVSWSMRDSAPAAASREVRALADLFTLITLGDSDVRMVTLIDVNVAQGELRTLPVKIPAGYELTGISGSSIETTESRDGTVVIAVADPSQRSHQFLVSLERQHNGESFALETGFVSVGDMQRERGEIAVEGVGTMELAAAEREGVHRIDVRELNQALQSLARLPVLAAFRYQRTAAAAPSLALDVKRFVDAGVLAAIADRAVATTLVTTEGRALTEVTLTLQNRAQPFLKVNLPPGASMVSVEVGGATAKPVSGSDGTRVPLLRPGFRPSGPYEVSFVYMHAGTPFERKGNMEMMLPRMDIPIGIVEWELFVPDRYSARPIGGNAIDWVTAMRGDVSSFHPEPQAISRIRLSFSNDGEPGQMRGHVTDAAGGSIPGATISLVTARGVRAATTTDNGTFLLTGVPAGEVTATVQLAGFAPARTSFMFDNRSRHLDVVLDVAGLTETITVNAEAQAVAQKRLVEPSQNVLNLQRRIAGVLPIRVDVPRAGTSHQFVKPLVVDQETVVKLRYKRR